MNFWISTSMRSTSAMRQSLTLGLLLQALVTTACKTPDDRAKQLGAQAQTALASGDTAKAIALYDQALAVKSSEDLFLARAEAVGKSAGVVKAIESLQECQTFSCREQRDGLAKVTLEKMQQTPVADAAAFRVYLRLEELSGKEPACALILALAATPKIDDSLRPPIKAALEAAIAHIQKQELDGLDPRDTELTNAKEFGETLGDETDCDSLAMIERRIGHKISDELSGSRTFKTPSLSASCQG